MLTVAKTEPFLGALPLHYARAVAYRSVSPNGWMPRSQKAAFVAISLRLRIQRLISALVGSTLFLVKIQSMSRQRVEGNGAPKCYRIPENDSATFEEETSTVEPMSSRWLIYPSLAWCPAKPVVLSAGCVDEPLTSSRNSR